MIFDVNNESSPETAVSNTSVLEGIALVYINESAEEYQSINNNLFSNSNPHLKVAKSNIEVKKLLVHNVIKDFIREKTDYKISIEKIKSINFSIDPLKKIKEILDVSPNPLPRPKKHELQNFRTGRSVSRGWSSLEDQRLIKGIHLFGVSDPTNPNWNKVAEFVGNGRSKWQCLQRWFRGLDPCINRGPWTREEDALLLQLVGTHGDKKWKIIGKGFVNRTDAQCRYRYKNLIKAGSGAGSNNDSVIQSPEMQQSPIFNAANSIFGSALSVNMEKPFKVCPDAINNAANINCDLQYDTQFGNHVFTDNKEAIKTIQDKNNNLAKIAKETANGYVATLSPENEQSKKETGKETGVINIQETPKSSEKTILDQPIFDKNDESSFIYNLFNEWEPIFSF